MNASFKKAITVILFFAITISSCKDEINNTPPTQLPPAANSATFNGVTSDQFMVDCSQSSDYVLSVSTKAGNTSGLIVITFPGSGVPTPGSYTLIKDPEAGQAGIVIWPDIMNSQVSYFATSGQLEVSFTDGLPRVSYNNIFFVSMPGAASAIGSGTFGCLSQNINPVSTSGSTSGTTSGTTNGTTSGTTNGTTSGTTSGSTTSSISYGSYNLGGEYIYNLNTICESYSNWYSMKGWGENNYYLGSIEVILPSAPVTDGTYSVVNSSTFSYLSPGQAVVKASEFGGTTDYGSVAGGQVSVVFVGGHPRASFSNISLKKTNSNLTYSSSGFIICY